MRKYDNYKDSGIEWLGEIPEHLDDFDEFQDSDIIVMCRSGKRSGQAIQYLEAEGFSNLYNLEATPAEGTTYRFAKEDKKRFPDILQAGFDDNIYYTNSSQIPVGHTDDPFEALELQNRLQCKYTGGTVLHLYMGEKLSSGEACRRFVKKVIENYQLPYITVTPVFSTCETHGYLNGEQPECPHCGAETSVWTRVMGYFRPVESFNTGKKGEHRERRHFAENRIESESLF